jgi:DNA primase
MSATIHSIDSDAWVDRARSVPIATEIKSRGIKLKGNGTERVGPCPKCGGEDRFSINTKKNVFNCRGCEVGGDVIDLVRHLDGSDFLTACARLTDEPPPQRPNGKVHSAEPHKVRTATYQYDDESGALAFMVDRFELQNPDGSFAITEEGKRRKKFLQRQPDPQAANNWIWSVKGAPIIPYRLPELIEAVANKRTILIAEGEAKADLLWSWNIPATCNACGAEKWCAEHSEYLRGADVVILPDNDVKGRKHADVVATALQGIAASVRVLNLPDLPPKGDIIDWANAGGTVERLMT